MNFEDYESLPTSSVATHMTAGAFAGVMEHCIMYPLDSVKTRMQSLVVPKVSDGVSQTLVRMMKQEGVMRPVRGMPAMIVGAGPAHAFYFSSYEYLKTTMTHHTHSTRYHPLIHGLSGCISTIFHDAIMNPAEVVKQRMQMYNSPYHSVIHCMRKIYKAEGLRAFYRSYTTQLTMNIPFQSIHFMVYEFAQKITNKDRKYNPSAHVVSGAMAGAIAAAITTPLDVCKTLLNTQQGGATTGLVEALKTVYRLGGPTGFFRGIQARVLFQMPATAICWTTYEFFKYVITNKLDDMRLVTPGPVYAEAEKLPPLPTDDSPPPSTSSSTAEKVSLKPRELPAMSGAGLYGSISFNTMHTADTNFTSRRNDTTILDMTHT